VSLLFANVFRGADTLALSQVPLQINAIHVTSPQACIQSTAISMPSAALAPLP